MIQNMRERTITNIWKYAKSTAITI